MHLQSGDGHLLAWADCTNPSLFHQFALVVAVGQPGGHSSPTGFGAGGPSCGLRHTLDSSDQHVAHWVTRESCTESKNKVERSLKEKGTDDTARNIEIIPMHDATFVILHIFPYIWLQKGHSVELLTR